MYIGVAPKKLNRYDRRLFGPPMAASRKAITKRWMTAEVPTIEDWVANIQEFYIIKKFNFLSGFKKRISIEFGPNGLNM